MLILRMQRGSMPKSESVHFDTFFAELDTAMQPLVRPTREAQAARLGVDAGSLEWASSTRRDPFYSRRRKFSQSEIYILDSGLLIIAAHGISRPTRYVKNPDGTLQQKITEEIRFTIEISAVMSTLDEANKALDAASAAAKSNFGIELSDHFSRSEKFGSIREEIIAEDLPDDEAAVHAAKSLADRSARALAISIKSSRGLLIKDIEKIVSTESAQALIEALVASGVVAREIVVVCGISQTQVARVPDKGSLVDLAKAGLRCACGKSIDRESATDLLTVTDLGVLLLDKSRWLSVLVREELASLGVRREDILLECQLGSDEVDCIALISGAVTIFELKDKEFSMGNAYSFSAKISLINPDRSIIVSTDKVASDVKQRFSRAKRDTATIRHAPSDDSGAIQYVEGDDFRAGLQRAICDIYREDAHTILENALQASVPDASSVLNSIKSLNGTKLPSTPTRRDRTKSSAS